MFSLSFIKLPERILRIEMTKTDFIKNFRNKLSLKRLSVLMGKHHYYGYVEDNIVFIKYGYVSYRFEYRRNVVVGRIILNVYDLLPLIFAIYLVFGALASKQYAFILFILFFFLLLIIGYGFHFLRMQKTLDDILRYYNEEN